MHLPQSNMEIFLIRQVKTIFLISTDLLLLREIQDHTFCIRSFRIKSILHKYHDLGKNADNSVITAAHSESEKNLMLELSKFNAVIEGAFTDTAPHKICSYIYDLANAFNSFYHETKIMSEEDETVQKSYIRLLELTKSVLETSIDLLGFSAPERM